MIFLGIGIIIVSIGLAVMLLGIPLDSNLMFGIGGILVTAPIILFLVAFGIWVATGGASKPSIVEGACYRAVGFTSTSVIPVGKVLVPTSTRNVALEEIRCP